MLRRASYRCARVGLGLLLAALVIITLLGGCGQKDPTQPLTGRIYVWSDTSGAAIFLDDVNTQQVTPDTLKDISIGSHVVRVRLAGFVSTPGSQAVHVSGGQLSQAFFTLQRLAGSTKLVLLEHFTSVNCGPCPEANRIINDVIETLGADQILGIEYHPWPADPFYNAATSENLLRANYYTVSTVPRMFVDGTTSPQPIDSLAIVAAVEVQLSEEPPVAIAVTDTAVGQSWAGTARLVGLSGIVASDLRGYFVVLEREVHYAQPPGTNGEKDFYYVMRRILPDASGQQVTIGAGDTLSFHQECDLHPDVDPSQVYSIYFLQDYLNRDVFQAGTSLPSSR